MLRTQGGKIGGTHLAFNCPTNSHCSRVGPSAMLAADSTLAQCKSVWEEANSSQNFPIQAKDSGPPPPPRVTARNTPSLSTNAIHKAPLSMWWNVPHARRSPKSSWKPIWLLLYRATTSKLHPEFAFLSKNIHRWRKPRLRPTWRPQRHPTTWQPQA